MRAGTALRFGHWFGVEAQLWLNLQTQFDLIITEQASGGGRREPALTGSTRLTARPTQPAPGAMQPDREEHQPDQTAQYRGEAHQLGEADQLMAIGSVLLLV